MMKVLISGASGFIGGHVANQLMDRGHEVIGLTRYPEERSKKDPRIQWIKWEGSNHVPDLSGIDHLDAIINLVGENLANKRWNNERKKEIYNSRVDGARALHEMVRAANLKPGVFISASAIGVYGDRGEETVDESSKKANDFLANLCKAWEEAALSSKDYYQRCVIVRIGLTLGKDGGIAKKIAPMFKLGLGGKLGSGSFYMSWIHVKDLARVFVKAVEDGNMNGIYNASSPFPVKNSEFTRTLAQAFGKPAPLKVPKFALRLVVGEMGEYILKGAKVLPKKLKEDNFHFLYPTIELAVKDVVSKS